MHPYHKEYMEILKAPILQHEKVFFWGAHNLHDACPHPAYKYLEQLEMVTACLEEPELPDKIQKYLRDNGIKDCYIYGDEKLSAFVLGILKTELEIKGFLARDICRGDICGVTVKCIWDYQPLNEDNIIVINYKYFQTIKRDFDLIGFKGKLIPLDSFIQSIGSNFIPKRIKESTTN